jgi:hypothetical protein
MWGRFVGGLSRVSGGQRSGVGVGAGEGVGAGAGAGVGQRRELHSRLKENKNIPFFGGLSASHVSFFFLFGMYVARVPKHLPSLRSEPKHPSTSILLTTPAGSARG